MRTAVCCFYQAYPPISGAAAVSFNIAKFLPCETLLLQAGSERGSIELQGLRVVTLPGGSESKIVKLAMFRVRLRAILDELRQFRPDLVMLEGASWAAYHWMLLRVIRRALPKVRVLYHAHNVEYLLRRQRNGSAIAALTRWAERRLLLDCDVATAVSELDQKLFRELYNVNTMLLPNGVDPARFAASSQDAVERVRCKYGIGNSAIIFSGLYAYPPNQVAIDFLLKDVMPSLLTHRPDARLVITGGGMPHRETWLTRTGIVPHDELPALLASCRVAVAPIFSGSGTRLKILEAMAAGVPVVSTSKGAEGLSLTHREHLLIADDAAHFIEYVLLLIKPGLRDVLVSNARKAVSRYFDWRAIAPLTLQMRRDARIDH